MPPADRSFAERYVRSLVRYRWLVVLLGIVGAISLTAGVRGLSFSNSYRSFFSPQNPQLRAFESLEKVYTKNDFLLFVLQPKEGEVFSRATLSVVADLTTRAWQLPFASRVDSLINFQHTRADGDDLVVEDLVAEPHLLTEDRLLAIRQIALAEPALYRRLISSDAHTTGVSVRLYLPGKSRGEVGDAAAAARALADEIRSQHAELRVELTGTVMLSDAFAAGPRNDSKFLFPLMFAALTLAMLFFLRSPGGVFAASLVMLLSTGAALGGAGWLGLQLNSASAMAPLIIMTLAIADSVHLLMTVFAAMHRGASKQDAFVESFRVNALPVLLTTLTTVIGFLGLNSSDAPPLRDLGNISAAGIVLAWFFSMTFLPALMMILPTRGTPPSGEPHSDRNGAAMRRLAEFVIARRRPLLWGGITVAILLSSLVWRLAINDRPVEYFRENNDFRRATEFTVDNLTGFYGFNFSLGAGEPGGISDPEYLRRVAAFTDWLRAQPEVVHVSAFTDTIKRLHRNLHGDDPAFYRLPESRDLAAQYLLLYEMSLPYGLDLNDQIDVDKSATRMTVACGDIDFRALKRLKGEAESWLRDNGLPSMRAEGSSPAVMFAYIGERSILSMAWGTGTSFLLIAIVLMLTLRHFRVGLLSLVPNVVPIAMGFGVWSIFVGEVDFAVSVVASVSLGIVDDNTVHFLTDYLRGRREEKLSTADAIRYAFTTVGSALWANSLILICGFGMLAFSDFWPNATLGLLTSTVIALAIVTDFLLLPPLLLWWDGDGS